MKLFARFFGKCDASFQSKHLGQLSDLIDRVTQIPAACSEESSSIIQLWDQLISLSELEPVDSSTEPVFTAMNSSIGHLTRGLLRVIRALNPNFYDEIPNHLRAHLQRLISGSMSAHHLARIIIAHSIAWLYQLKRGLVLPSFLARFDWTNPNEAKGMWCGYLLAPSLTPELWLELSPYFLKTFADSTTLGEYEAKFYQLFAIVLIRPEYELDKTVARNALRSASTKGRANVVEYLLRLTDSATDYGANLFRDCLKDLFEEIWPHENDFREPESSSFLAQLALNCGSNFHDAVAAFTPLIVPCVNIDYIMHTNAHLPRERFLRTVPELITRSSWSSGRGEL